MQSGGEECRGVAQSPKIVTNAHINVRMDNIPEAVCCATTQALIMLILLAKAGRYGITRVSDICRPPVQRSLWYVV